MALDVRAEIICNLGPVISGNVKDDHIQGQGLVFTTGEIVIAGLITPAKGASVTLAYITPDGGRAARFPRGPFRVKQSFANPLTNQTTVTIADTLAYLKGTGGGKVSSALTQGLNGRMPTKAPVVDLNETAAVICSRAGIAVGNLGGWSLPKQIERLDSADYVETLSEMLASAGRVGYMDPQNKLQTIAYADLENGGPSIGFDKVIDLSPNAGGLDFSEKPKGTGTAQVLKESEGTQILTDMFPDVDSDFGEDGTDGTDGTGETGETDETVSTPRSITYTPGNYINEQEYGNFSADWNNSSTSKTSTLLAVLKDGSTRSFGCTETVETREKTAEPDGRTLERITTETAPFCRKNMQAVQDALNEGSGDGGANSTQTSRKIDHYTYEEIQPEPMSEKDRAQLDAEIERAKNSTSGITEIVILPELPTYRMISHQSTTEIPAAEALGRVYVKNYAKAGSMPGGSVRAAMVQVDYLYGSGFVRKIHQKFGAYGMTQMGQQAIGAAGGTLDQALSQFSALVLEDYWVTTSRDSSTPKPVPGYLSGFADADVVIQGTTEIQIGQTAEDEATGSGGSGGGGGGSGGGSGGGGDNGSGEDIDLTETVPITPVEFEVPFLPDDVVNDDGTITEGLPEEAAERYAEEQNLLLLGHRIGMQVVTALGQLPQRSLAPFHLTNGGITAMYRTNGLSWAFDSSSCLVSTDALYWGLVGGSVNGPRWTPVAPGVTALPTPPAVVNNGAQNPVNSVPLTGTLDVTDQAAVDAILASLPDDDAETFEEELTPTDISPPYTKISRVSLFCRAVCDVICVPNGVNRDLGSGEMIIKLVLESRQTSELIIRPEFDSDDGRIIAETFSGGLNLGGNLS